MWIVDEMSAEKVDVNLREEIRQIVAEIIEVDPEEIGLTTRIWDELDADSLNRIEIMSALERRFHITIEESRAGEMEDVQTTYDLVMETLKATRSDGS
jgi:acyl carrier protein